MHKINGIYSAALTPINDDLSINKNLYLEHCQYLMKQGHDGLAIFGTTGEANSFSIKEKCDTIDFLKNLAHNEQFITFYPIKVSRTRTKYTQNEEYYLNINGISTKSQLS